MCRPSIPRTFLTASWSWCPPTARCPQYPLFHYYYISIIIVHSRISVYMRKFRFRCVFFHAYTNTPKAVTYSYHEPTVKYSECCPNPRSCAKQLGSRHAVPRGLCSQQGTKPLSPIMLLPCPYDSIKFGQPAGYQAFVTYHAITMPPWPYQVRAASRVPSLWHSSCYHHAPMAASSSGIQQGTKPLSPITLSPCPHSPIKFGQPAGYQAFVTLIRPRL